MAACASTTTFDQQRDERRPEGRIAAQRPDGLRQEAARRRRQVEPGTGALRGFFAGQDYLESQINWALAGRLAGLVVQALRAGRRAEGRLLAQEHLRGQLAERVPDGPTSSTRGRATATTTARRLLAQGPRGLRQHRLHRPHPSMNNGPQKILKTAVAMGIPRKTLPASKPNAGHRARLGHGQPDRHGRRLRDLRQRGSARRRHSCRRSPTRTARCCCDAPRRDEAGAAADDHRRRELRPPAGGAERHRHRAQAWVARPQARPAPRPTPTATCRRRGSWATRRSSRPP